MQNYDAHLFNALSYTQKKGDLKKLEIIESAIECLATIGYEKTTYEAIALKMNTRRAHIAYHFRDKKDIFEAAVKYILATYQITTTENMVEGKSGKDIIKSYVESAFIWAKANPHQLSVMLLLYYLCSLGPEYVEINEKVRKDGGRRLLKILQTHFSSLDKKKLIVEKIQNSISANIIESVTTKDTTIDKAKRNAISSVYALLDL